MTEKEMIEMAGEAAWMLGYKAGYSRGVQDGMRTERDACLMAINSVIKPGIVQGDGWDEVAERNGLILATNILTARGEA